MSLENIMKEFENGNIKLVEEIIKNMSPSDKKNILNEMRKINIKEIIATCKEKGNGKILSVEIEGQDNLETVDQVVKEYSSGQGYKIKNGEEVKPYDDHNDRIRSHANNTSNDNLRSLPLSRKCK